MRLLLCSVFPSRFHRHGNQKNQTDSKKQVQDSCATQSVAAIANPTSQDCKDTTQISDNNDNISQLPSPPRPASTKQIHIPISRSGAQSPPRLPTDSAHRDSSIASLPVQLWDRAYNDFKREEMELVDSYEKILSRQLQEGLGSKVPKSQLNIIAQDEPDRRRHQMIQLIHSGLDKTESEAKLKDNLKVPVDVIFSAKNIISSAIQAVPQAALAWSGICVALEVLANPINQTEANRKGIDYVIKRMDWYWSLSNSVFRDLPDHDTDLSGIRRQLEDRLVDLYKALLSYQIKSVYSYFQNRGLIFFQDMIKLDDWDAELEAVQEAEKSFQDDTHAFSTQQMLSHSNQIVTQGRNQEIRQASKEDQQCLQHLRLTNPRDDKSRIERTKGGLLQDSYRWVLDNHDFQQWRDHKESQLLWIKGDPGKGKTMLLSGIINELDQGNTANVRNSNVAYFFCQATDSRINSATAVLRGLIYMLADQQPSLLSHVRNEYERAGESLFSDRNTWDVLLTIFTNVQQDTSLKMTYLIIDALDECVTDRPQLLDLIAKRSSNSSRVKWIVSSRNWPEIKEQFGMATQKATLSLELNAESVAEAVNAYIRHKVSQLSNRKKYNNKTRTAIQEYLSSNAKDTFLWVALVCKALEDPSLRNWQSLKMLETFPAGLDSLYGLMMQRIKNLREADLCRNILAVIATVRRPISLEEITSIVEMPDGLCDESEDLEEIISLCGSFLTLQNKTIYFVHQSAKDFLLGKASNNRHSQEAFNWVFHSGIEEVNYSILLKSLQAMSTTLQRDMYHLSVPGFMIDQVPKQDPDPLVTVRYSCVYWIHHLCDLISTTSSKRDVLQEHGIIHTFFKTKYLYWLEALSLFGAMSNGIKVMKQLQSQLENNTHEHLTAIIRDGYRFVMSYGRIIEQAPLQAYTSALVFAPTHSLVKENFKQEEPKWLSNQPVVEAQWNACLQTLEGHGGWVRAMGARLGQLCSRPMASRLRLARMTKPSRSGMQDPAAVCRR
ncbi:NACHT domain-containing protein [Podospora fimiseda]|uniref:NACHT domain-containing protein n=1 Tax=Podospora fimiseda TaxID=252190 RepID=A0AAN7BE44_9PEZI|nr:NACHT domain-containing protein [Podospora fimiseda]